SPSAKLTYRWHFEDFENCEYLPRAPERKSSPATPAIRAKLSALSPVFPLTSQARHAVGANAMAAPKMQSDAPMPTASGSPVRRANRVITHSAKAPISNVVIGVSILLLSSARRARQCRWRCGPRRQSLHLKVPFPNCIDRRVHSQLQRNEVKMPPIIGAAMRFITSAPLPVDHMIGTSPRNITETVMTFGRRRLTAPCRIASLRSFQLLINPLASASW